MNTPYNGPTASQALKRDRRRVGLTALLGVVILLVPVLGLGSLIYGVREGQWLVAGSSVAFLTFYGLIVGRDVKEAVADGAVTYTYMRAGKE